MRLIVWRLVKVNLRDRAFYFCHGSQIVSCVAVWFSQQGKESWLIIFKSATHRKNPFRFITMRLYLYCLYCDVIIVFVAFSASLSGAPLPLKRRSTTELSCGAPAGQTYQDSNICSPSCHPLHQRHSALHVENLKAQRLLNAYSHTKI